jgi:MFS family permease
VPIAALRPLRSRGFAVMWTGGLVSNIGTWMQTVAVGALVTDITGQAAWTAIAFVASFAPNGLLGPVGGALADRLPRKPFIIASNAAEAAIALAIAFHVAGGGDPSPAVITGLVFLGGCVGALRMPFQQAILPDLVPREDMLGAISLGSAQWNLGRMLGPALAGLVIAVGSFSLAFAANAISFFAVIIAFLLIRLPEATEREEYTGLVNHIRLGVRAVREEPGCRAAMILIAAAALTAAPFMALIPAFAAFLTDGGAKETAGATGALTTAQGVGAVIGSLALASLAERFGRRRMLVVDLLLTPIALVPYALSPSVATATVAIVFVGGAYIGVLSGLSAVVQLRAPTVYRGRVLSLFFGTLSVVFPIGAVIQGAVADRIGLRLTTILSAAALASVVGLIAVTRPHLLAALDDPPDEEEDPAVITDAATATAAAS